MARKTGETHRRLDRGRAEIKLKPSDIAYTDGAIAAKKGRPRSDAEKIKKNRRDWLAGYDDWKKEYGDGR